MNHVNMLETMPIAYARRIATVSGVTQIAHATILIAYYQEPKNGLAAIAVDLDVLS